MTSRRKPVTVDIRRRKALSEIASAADQRATDQLRSVVRLLSVLVLIGGLATLAGSVYIAVRAYTPVWFGDEWSVPLDYQVGRPLPSMEALGTAQRASYPDYEGTTADGPVLVQRRSQTFTPFELADPDFPLGAITYFLHVVRRFSTADLATLAGITAFCVFNPNQMSLLSNTGSSSLK